MGENILFLGTLWIFYPESENNKTKMLWIGNIELGKEDTETKIDNLIEALFATTIVKAQYKKEDKGIYFDFLLSLFEK